MFQVALIFVKEETAITAEEGMGEWAIWKEQWVVPVKSGFSSKTNMWKGSQDRRAKGHAGPSVYFFPQPGVKVKKDCFTSGIGSEDAEQVSERTAVEKQ